MKKGVSPVVSYVLIVSIVLVTTITAYNWALPLSKELGEQGRIMNYKNQMIGLDYTIRSTAHGDINFVNEYEMHLQDQTSIRLDKENEIIYLILQPRATILGKQEQCDLYLNERNDHESL